MARKTLLTEGEIRQFIKLANLTNVSDGKIQEMYGGGTAYGRDEEDTMEEGPEDGPEELDMAVSDPDAEDELDGEMGAEMGPEMADDAMDMDAADSMDVSEREALMADVVAAVAQALGIEDRVDVEASDEDDMGDMDDMGVDMGMDDMGDLEEPDLGAPEGGDDLSLADEEEEDEELPQDLEMKNDELVAEVARRVASRLKNEQSREVMVDTLAERIMKRLTATNT